MQENTSATFSPETKHINQRSWYQKLWEGLTNVFSSLINYIIAAKNTIVNALIGAYNWLSNTIFGSVSSKDPSEDTNQASTQQQSDTDAVPSAVPSCYQTTPQDDKDNVSTPEQPSTPNAPIAQTIPNAPRRVARPVSRLRGSEDHTSRILDLSSDTEIEQPTTRSCCASR
jgi:hypothetical protein